MKPLRETYEVSNKEIDYLKVKKKHFFFSDVSWFDFNIFNI